MPPAARGTGKASAEAFARYYVDLISYAIVSGDTTELKALAMNSCTGCFAVIKSIDGVYKQAGHVDQRRGWIVLGEPRATGRPVSAVTLKVRVTREVLYQSLSASPSPSRPNTGRMVLHVTRAAGRWRLREVDYLDAS